MPPGLGGFAGQFCFTTIFGVVTSGQIAEAVAETTFAEQESVPCAVTVLGTAQESAGAAKRATKSAETPGARLGTVRTLVGTAWSSMTVALIKVTLPELWIVPV